MSRTNASFFFRLLVGRFVALVFCPLANTTMARSEIALPPSRGEAVAKQRSRSRETTAITSERIKVEHLQSVTAACQARQQNTNSTRLHPLSSRQSYQPSLLALPAAYLSVLFNGISFPELLTRMLPPAATIAGVLTTLS